MVKLRAASARDRNGNVLQERRQGHFCCGSHFFDNCKEVTIFPMERG